jgi:hypothetical protein
VTNSDSSFDAVESPLSSALGQAPESLIETVWGLPSIEREKAAYIVQKALFSRAADGAGLDAYIAVIRGLIDRGIAAAEHSLAASQLKDSYNTLSYNLAADLADCWPGDLRPREPRHFEAGLRAADDCIRWRMELNKAPRALAVAHWAKGIHLLALRQYNAAAKSFDMSLGYALRAEQDMGGLAPFGVESSLDVVLGTGYLGLAEWLDGEERGKQRYEQSLEVLQNQLALAINNGNTQLQSDAELGIAQLETVREKYLG